MKQTFTSLSVGKLPFNCNSCNATGSAGGGGNEAMDVSVVVLALVLVVVPLLLPPPLLTLVMPEALSAALSAMYLSLSSYSACTYSGASANSWSIVSGCSNCNEYGEKCSQLFVVEFNISGCRCHL